MGIHTLTPNGTAKVIGSSERDVKSIPVESRRFEFSFPRLDTQLQVEVVDAAVTIRASRDTFSAQRKVCFIRELAAEGFIPEHYHWFNFSGSGAPFQGVRWFVDLSWMDLSVETIARARRFMLRLFAGAVLLETLLLGALFTGHLGKVRVGPRSDPHHEAGALSFPVAVKSRF